MYSGPYSFDPNLSWYENGFFYHNLEAIYVGEAVAISHPEWIIKDSNGNNLYVNWGCLTARAQHIWQISAIPIFALIGFAKPSKLCRKGTPQFLLTMRAW